MSEEERGRTALLRQHSCTLLSALPGLFTVLAAHSKRQGAEPRLGDLITALETIAVRISFEPPKRLVDLVERLGLHLNQRKLDVLLDIDLGALAIVENVTVPLGPNVAHSALKVAHQLSAAVLKHLFEFVIPTRSRRCLLSFCRCHDSYRSFQTNFNRSGRYACATCNHSARCEHSEATSVRIAPPTDADFS